MHVAIPPGLRRSRIVRGSPRVHAVRSQQGTGASHSRTSSTTESSYHARRRENVGHGRHVARRDASGPAGLSSPSSGGRAADRRWRWRWDDIAVGAALGVACGLVFWLFNFAYAWLSPIIGGILPGLASILYPLWYFSGTLAVIILRKPGAAVYVNLVGSAAEMLLGNQFSFGFASAALQGVFAELRSHSPGTACSTCRSPCVRRLGGLGIRRVPDAVPVSGRIVPQPPRRHPYDQ